MQASDAGVKLFDSANSPNVIYTDINASNGVLHLIDGVLIPPGNIAEVATANGFSTLVDLVTTAGLAGAVTGEDELTVFAPTNDAFAAPSRWCRP